MNSLKFEDSDLGCEALSLGEHFSTFRNMYCLRSFEKLRSTHTTPIASHITKLNSSAKPLWEP